MAEIDQKKPDPPRFVRVDELRPDDCEDGCLRPLGLCELGGCCDCCFYGQQTLRKRAKGR